LDTTIQLSELATFNDTLTHDLMKNYEKNFGEKIKNIKRSSEDIANVADRLDLAIKNAWGSLDKTTSEQGLRLTQTIKETGRKLSGYEIESNYAKSEEFHKTAVEISNKIILSIRKYVPKLHKVLKTDIAALNSTLTKLESSINSLGIALDDSPGRALETLELETKVLLVKKSTAKELEIRNQEIEQSILQSTKDEENLLNEQNQLLSREEFLILQKCENSLKSEIEKIEQLLQPIAKPLRKFERTLTEDSPIDPNILEKLIENPKEAISKYSTQSISRILNSLNDALNQGKLGIEERKRRKAQEVIEAANRGELEKRRTTFLSIQNNTQTATDILIANGLFDKNERLKQLLTKTRSESEQLKTTQNSNRKKIEELTKVISKQKALIESEILKLSGRKISIIN
jgi:hypothetical protein